MVKLIGFVSIAIGFLVFLTGGLRTISYRLNFDGAWISWFPHSSASIKGIPISQIGCMIFGGLLIYGGNYLLTKANK